MQEIKHYEHEQIDAEETELLTPHHRRRLIYVAIAILVLLLLVLLPPYISLNRYQGRAQDWYKKGLS